MSHARLRHGSRRRGPANAAILGVLGWLLVACSDGEVFELRPGGEGKTLGPPVLDVRARGHDAPRLDTWTPPGDLVEGAQGFAPDVSCDPSLRVRRSRSWPGGGVQLVVERRPLQGERAAPDLALVQVWAEGGEQLRVAARAADRAVALTVLVLQTSADSRIHAQRIAAARGLVDALEDGDKAALFVADELGIRLLADSSARLGYLRTTLERVLPSEGRFPGRGALDSLKERVRELEGPWAFAKRNLVIIGDGRELHPIADGEVGVLSVSENVAGFDPRMDRAGWLGTEPAPFGLELAGYLKSPREVVVGACFRGQPHGRLLEVALDSARCLVEVPEAIVHEQGLPCVPDEAAADQFPFGNEVHVLQNELEAKAWEANHAAESKAPMAMQIQFGDGAPISATGHFRGGTSLNCQRKSLSIELDGPKVRLAGHSAADEVLLISLCKDQGFFRQVLADRIMQSLHLFGLEFRLVHLTHNDVSLGAYLLLEKANHSIRRMLLDEAAVIRRENDARGEQPELKYPNDPAGAEAALSAFAELAKIAKEEPPGELMTRLEEHMDIDNYLRWLAMNTYFENGDYVDEAYFYASHTASGPLYFSMFGWDPDDLQDECHHRGENEIVDPNGLTYCLEADLDRALGRSAAVYGRFLEHLRWFTSAYSSERVHEMLMGVQADLLSALPSDAACAAMGHGSDCAAFASYLAAQIDGFESRLDEWRSTLTMRLDATDAAP